MQIMSTHTPPPEAALPQRATALFQAAENDLHKHTDKLFAKLMIIQWVAGIAAALWISPQTWIGAASQTHLHVWAALFLGGAISALPVWLAWQQPGRPLTRHVIGAAQMLTSALLIHLTGGRIETHFHVFGSLAFLAFYRDWRVLLTATVVVAADHLARGLFWPQSVFGTLTASPWRWLEHAGWVLFEDTFLVISIGRMLSDMFEVAMRRAKLEDTNADIERQVIERTTQLSAAQAQLLEASRQAGMAEIATNVLHNVGNVLNSVNVSAEAVAGKVRQFRIGRLKSVAELLTQHRDTLPDYLTNDPKGRVLPDYLVKLAEDLAGPQNEILEEVESLRSNIEHIKEVVAMQQAYARRSGVVGTFPVIDMVEDAIRINNAALHRHGVTLERDYETVPPVVTDRHKVLQILVNLLSNAKYAMDHNAADKQLVVRVALDGADHVAITVKDNGTGIAPENLTQIFGHGFTTKEDGHGFGLHSGALAARELGGALIAQSDGPGLGAVFTLKLPLNNPDIQ